MLKGNRIHSILSGVLLTMLIGSIIMAGLVFLVPQSALAAPLNVNETPPPGTDSIGLGCICENYNDRLYKCCNDAYWHPTPSPGWLQCNGGWYYEWFLPQGCDVWD